MRAICCRIPEEATPQDEQRNRRARIGEALRRVKEALPAVTGALIAAAAAIIFARPAALPPVESAGVSKASAQTQVSSAHGLPSTASLRQFGSLLRAKEGQLMQHLW
jgi:hypothetical protein